MAHTHPLIIRPVSWPLQTYRSRRVGRPPAFPSRPSRGLRPRAPLRRYPLPSCAACPGRPAPRSAWRRGVPAGLLHRAGRQEIALGEEWPLRGGCRGSGTKMPFKLPIRTQSRSIPATLEGFYWPSTRRRWIRDRVVLLTVDHEFSITDPQLHAEIDEWKQNIAQLYFNEGSRQEEIWVIIHPVWRYD